jgi:hypothetical protein
LHVRRRKEQSASQGDKHKTLNQQDKRQTKTKK